MISRAMYIDRAWLCLSLLVFTVLVLGMLNTCRDTYLKASQGVEVDVCADVYRVVDGDTLDVFPVGRVRLADIDAPELGTAEGELAKQVLSSLVDTYGPLVYLDVDDLYVMDRYNRVVAVVYLRYNSTHVINVNRWLVDNGYASISDYGNEFNPYTWKPYVYLPYDPCLGEVTTLTVTMLSTATTTVTSVSTTAQTITTYTPPLEIVIEKTTTVVIEKTVTYTKTAITTAVEKTTTMTRIYAETYTLATAVTTTIVKENWVLTIMISAIAAVLFALGYTLGKRVSM